MTPLVTLTQARSHLRVVTDREDDEIYRKIGHATGIVLDYLKARAHTRATLVHSSVANPTVLTTETDHGFTTGDTVLVSGHAGSTPDLTGSYLATVTGLQTFTIPVAVTVAGTGGTALVEWTPDTAPPPVTTAVLLMLTHLFENRGDDLQADEAVWRAIERLLMRLRDPAYA